MLKKDQLLGELTRALLGHGRGSRLAILIYHRVHAVADEMAPDEVDARTFDWQMACLSKYARVLPLDTAVGLLRRSELPCGAVAVTFDDGYRDNFEVALPILRRHGINATFFVATGFLGDGVMFNDVVIESLRRTRLARIDLGPLGLGCYDLHGIEARRSAVRQILARLKYTEGTVRFAKAVGIAEAAQVEIPAGLMMTAEQVQGLHRAGMTIGAHTVNHPILKGLSADEAASEIDASKRSLETITSKPVTLFAYPNGRPGIDYGIEEVSIVRDLGFAGAVSTAAGVASRATDIHQLPRFTPWDRTPVRFMARLVRNAFAREAVQV